MFRYNRTLIALSKETLKYLIYMALGHVHEAALVRCHMNGSTIKDDFQSALRTLESLSTFFVLIHVRRHKI